MSTCRWCTPGGSVTTDLLKRYAAKELRDDDFQGANDDLSYCMECVVEYHRVRDELPHLHKALWKLETSRLIVQLENSMREEIEDDDELFLVEDDGEKQLFGYTGPNFESNLRIPILEILKYPYLLLSPRVSELCADALCKMEQVNNPFLVYEKLPGVYLLLVFPNENIRRWAIVTARAQGKVDRDDYYDLQEVFTCLFKVIELGLFDNPDIYSYSDIEEGKLILLPDHLYDTANYKNYWLGICMLLTVLEDQAMDSLLLGHDRQNDFMLSILHIMEKQTEDESSNPFWPALHCFMMILDRLGSKVWGRLIDPIQAFQTIIGSPSYNSEIENIRDNYKRPPKHEPGVDSDDDIVSCSQMVYSFNTEKVKKDTGWKSAICPDYCPNMYEEMQSLANILQSDIGQDMRVHNSTFLWFVPFVQSVMDLKDMGVAYIMEVIHHLYSEIKDVLYQRHKQCDKVTELFILVLVSIIELHRNKKCLHFLWVSSHKWVEALVKCSLLPVKELRLRNNSKITTNSALSCSPNSQNSSSVQYACIQLIRSLLREGYQLGQQATCKQYLDKLNLVIRGNVLRNLELTPTEAQGLQACLKQIIKCIKDHASTTSTSLQDQNTANKIPSVPFIKTERLDDDDEWLSCNSSPRSPVETKTDYTSADITSCPGGTKTCQEAKPSGSLQYSPCSPSISLATKTSIKIEYSDNPVLPCGEPPTLYEAAGSTAVCASNSLEHEGGESKSGLSGWQEKLSKVIKKASSLKCKVKQENSAPESKITSNSSCESKTDLSVNVSHVKTEHCDTDHARDTDGSDSDDCLPVIELKRPLKVKRKRVSHESLHVAKKLEELSLDHSCANQKSRPINRDALLSLTDAGLAGKFTGTTNPRIPDLIDHCSDIQVASDDDNMPLSEVKKKLIKRRDTVMTPLTNSQVDRDLDGLSLAAHAKCLSFSISSSQESIITHEPEQIERKVKGTTRLSAINDSSSDTEKSPDQIITISDSSSEEEAKPIIQSVKPDKMEVLPCKEDERIPSASNVEPKNETTSFTCDEYNSQFFEFETEDEVFSVWTDSQTDEKQSKFNTDISNTNNRKNTLSANSTDLADDFNQWGYDTDYIPDEVIEKAVEAAEEKIQLSDKGDKVYADPKETTSNEGLRAGTVFGEDEHKLVTEKSKTTAERNNKLVSPKKGSSLSNKLSTKKKSKTKFIKSPLKAHKENKRHDHLHNAGPAVVLPKKIHTRPGPSSTAEKLSLIKPQRKAFDLSQRSLDSLAELRDYGKAAGFVEAKKQRTKLISPQSMLSKANKKLLACQERQFYRQSRPKDSEKEKQAETDSSRKLASSGKKIKDRSRKETSVRHNKNKNTATNEKPSFSKREKACNGNLPCVPKMTNMVSADQNEARSKKDDAGCALSMAQLKHSSSAGHGDNVGSSVLPTIKEPDDYEQDEDGLFLTQADPIDMDICSQEDHDIDISVNEENGLFAKMDCSSSSAPPSTDKPKCNYANCLENVNAVGDYCAKHMAPEKADDDLFVKPGLPMSLQKSTKPSTTKIFSAGSASRSANLTKDLENLSKPQSVSKSKPLPGKPSVPSMAVAPPVQTVVSAPKVTNNILKPLINQTNILPVKMPHSHNLPQPPVAKLPLQLDQAWLMREILRWRYDMFDQVSQFGVPNNLCQLPLVKVPLKFSGYDQYCNVFLPLTLLNTFESLVQELSVKQRAIESHVCKLHLQNFCPDSQVNRGEFQAWILDADLHMQRHPKEDDFVFLITPESSSRLPGEEAVPNGPPVYHTAYVSRFTRSQRTQSVDREQYTLCDLSIHTYSNLSAFRNQQVRCLVVGSLITTQRQFKALLQLQRNPLFRPIIHPYHTDFFPRDATNENISLLSLREYNHDQRSAIEKSYAMVRQHPRLARICLIHGPPGTGKSKTIVGLLYRILMEKSNNVPNQNVKNKRNRVLVCAPSNAAIDDLMKKIILEFKEKCHDKKNPLGNCGDINLVRLGSEKTISNDVVKFSLDRQVNYRINRAQQDQDIHRRKEELDRQLDALCRQRAMERCNKNTCIQLDDQIGKLSKERQLLANSLKELRRRPQEVQRNIILESHIICCTLSTSGGLLLESAFRQLGQEPFSCVIVDEAGQSCEVETLIPLLHRCSKLVLVGDPEQLPPTVISVKAEDLGYGQSLMSRLCQHLESTGQKSAVMKLTVQYRMHPDICLFPNNYFYKRILKTDRTTEETRCSSDWPFQPYMLFDVADGYEKKERESYSNPQEIKVVMALIKLIKSKMKENFRNIGVISPYRAQKMMIIEALRKSFGNDNRPGEVDTVDGFQGCQKDCIIVTCVRANSIQGCIGFLASRQRMNVTITRAKFSLFILGSLRTLMENKDWNNLIQDAHRRGAIVKTREEHYQRDVTKILKLKAVVQRPLPPTCRGEERSGNRPKDIPCNTLQPEAPKQPLNPPREAIILPRAATPPLRVVVHPALDSFKSLPSSSAAASMAPVRSQKLRDPRLARRLQTTNTTNPQLPSLPQQPNSSASYTHQNPCLSSTAGAKRVHEPKIKDSRVLSEERRVFNESSKDIDYRLMRRPSESEQDVKKRKVSY
ncbi:probable helicase senataxin [Bombina bombina]|uniref:probable helicase senataxin n=1 Tax=Bombina bombina TaxID=8345 RepID=UPI00235AB3AA|nr:probable helicase senataxin [Bombina bombina]